MNICNWNNIIENINLILSNYQFHVAKSKDLIDSDITVYFHDSNFKQFSSNILDMFEKNQIKELFESIKFEKSCLLFKLKKSYLFSSFISSFLLVHNPSHNDSLKQKHVYLSSNWLSKENIKNINSLRILLIIGHISKILLKNGITVKYYIDSTSMTEVKKMANKYNLDLNISDSEEILDNLMHVEYVDISLASNQTSSRNNSYSVKCANVACYNLNEKLSNEEIIYSLKFERLKRSFQSKYGSRFSEAIMNPKIKDLTQASLKFDLLSVKASRHVNIDLSASDNDAHGGIFVMYNCARISTLFSNYQKMVDEGLYPCLPEASEIDFSLLNKKEEWSLFFNYIFYFPSLCKDIGEPASLQTHKIAQFVINLSMDFSKYYSKTRILAEPKSHLFGIVHARIYLIKAIEKVLHDALYLLDINPIQQI